MKKTLLLVDDDLMVLELLLVFVRDICDVISASTAKRALELISSENGISGLITDYNLQDPSGVDGLQIAAAFKEKNPESFVILATGSFLSASQLSLIREQLKGVLLEKPFHLEDLTKAIIPNLTSYSGGSGGGVYKE